MAYAIHFDKHLFYGFVTSAMLLIAAAGCAPNVGSDSTFFNSPYQGGGAFASETAIDINPYSMHPAY